MGSEVDRESLAPSAPRVVQATTEFLLPLVRAAAEGDQQAWRSLVARFSPLGSGIIARYRLNSYDADVVGSSSGCGCFKSWRISANRGPCPGGSS